MNNAIKTILLAAAGVALSLVLIGGGFLLGRSSSIPAFFMGPDFREAPFGRAGCWDTPGGLMGSGRHSWGRGECLAAEQIPAAVPLTMEETEDIIQDWLEEIGQDGLILEEIMVFDNHAYAQIMEEDTGLGAMEVLVDPTTREVYPEHGPNMMWNQKYSRMASMHRGSWGAPAGTAESLGQDMPVTLAEAAAAAQSYLDQYYPGREVADHGDAFYGYYTLHVEEDGEVVGMLSVNGYTSQVFYHTWHGELLEMSEH